MPTLRQWWDEDRDLTQEYYNAVLWKQGPAPHPLPSDVAEQVVVNHLNSPSMPVSYTHLIVYLVALPMAKLLAFICKLGVLLLWKKSDNIETFCRIKKHRIVGSLVIITAIITFFFNL